VARPCDCRERQLAKARSHGVASAIPAKYRGASFERPPVTAIDPMVVRAVRTYCEDIDAMLDDGRGRMLIGDVGTGKTTLAMIISKAAIAAGRTVAVYSLPKLLARIRGTYDSLPGQDSYEQFFQRLTSVDLLHLDDLGAEKRSDWVLEQLYSLVNERYEQQRAIIVTANAHEDDDGDAGAVIDRLKEEVDARTVSRLVEICGDPLPLFGEDRRVRLAS